MNEENDILDEELDVSKEPAEENEEDLSEEDQDTFEEAEEESEEEEPDEELEEEQDEETDTEDTSEVQKKAEEKNSDIEEKYKKLLGASRRILKTFEVDIGDETDIAAAIDKLGAENSGKSIEEYNKHFVEQDELLEFKNYKAEREREATEKAREAKFSSDLAEIQAEYPAARKYKHLSELPNVSRYAELMKTGKMTAAEAYRASHKKEIEESISGSVRQSSLNDTKAHLRASVPKKAASDGVQISRAEMDYYREMLPDASDKEIREYHRRATK